MVVCAVATVATPNSASAIAPASETRTEQCVLMEAPLQGLEAVALHSRPRGMSSVRQDSVKAVLAIRRHSTRCRGSGRLAADRQRFQQVAGGAQTLGGFRQFQGHAQPVLTAPFVNARLLLDQADDGDGI